MRNTDLYVNKKIAIIGLARSGLACANLLCAIGANVRVTDLKQRSELTEAISQLISSSIRVECGGHTEETIAGCDMAVLSPGIADTALPVRWAIKHGIPIYSEIEIAWTLCPAPVIAITGSTGKTTTATLMGKVLEDAGINAIVCGNIGNPFSGEVARFKPQDYVVLEVSSFQLEKIKNFRPHIAIVTNVSKNHLDRYPGMEEYISAKKRIFLNQQPNDYLLLNKCDPASKEFGLTARSQIVYFGQDTCLNQNQAAVAKAADIMGIPDKVYMKTFKDFKGIEHRMEYVARINDVSFINDSKATTVESTMWALRNIPQRAVLIAGGKDKGLDYSLILELARQKVRSCILIGEAADKISRAFQGIVFVEKSPNLKDAVHKAFKKALPGDTVLLSPMCSSYDMFNDYEERGRAFKKIVLEIEANAGIKG